MKEVFIRDCEVITIESELRGIILPQTTHRVWIRAGEELVELIPRTIFRTRKGWHNDVVREASIDGGKTWSVDARYVGTPSQPHDQIQSEEL